MNSFLICKKFLNLYRFVEICTAGGWIKRETGCVIREVKNSSSKFYRMRVGTMSNEKNVTE
jgi:hypothetical protein